MCPTATSLPANGNGLSAEALKRQLAQPTLQAPLANPSLIVTADHQLKTADAPVYAPQAGEVLVHVKATGICGYEAILPPRFRAYN